jgi:hypothetical protein
VNKLGLFLFACLLASLAAADSVRYATEFQKTLDSLPRGDQILRAETPIGGLVEFPVGDVKLVRPLVITSGGYVKGKSWGGTRLWADFDGPAVIFDSASTHAVGPMISDVAIYNKRGDGIGVAAGKVIEYPTIRNVVLNVGGTALKMNPPKGDDPIYFPIIDNVIVAYAGGNACDLRATGYSLQHFYFCNATNDPTRQAGVRSPAMAIVSGDGAIRDSRFEGNWGTLLYLKAGGSIIASGNYFEPYRDKARPDTWLPQIVIEGPEAISAHVPNVQFDHFMFVQPDAPIEIRGRVVVCVQSHELNHEGNDGNTDPHFVESKGNVPDDGIRENGFVSFDHFYRVGPEATLMRGDKIILGKDRTR